MGNPVTRFFASRGFARGLGAVGRFMITSGTVILLLVAYQLWGTNLQTNKAQTQLASEFGTAEDAAPLVSRTTTSTTATTAPTTTTTAVGDPTTEVTAPIKVAPKVAPPTEGQVVGNISIPSIGLRNFWFVEGTGVDELKRGAAHYPDTVLPGQKGNAAIAGHRTTYGAPFHNIDKVKPGDVVQVKTLYGTFTYKVTSQKVVKPSDVSVLEDQGGANTLTLTACHPKFSAKERIITFATLVGNPVAKLPNQDKVAQEIIARAETHDDNANPTSIDEFSTEPVVKFPGAWWGVGCMLLWIAVRLLAWFGHRDRRYPRWIPYLVGTPLCLLMLYFFFEVFSYEAFTRVLNLNI